MAEQNQMRPSSPQEAPDPSFHYDRSHPGREAGMGRLDNNMRATPTDQPDHTPDAVRNAQDPTRQINAHDVVNGRAVADPNETARDQGPRPGGGAAPVQPDHSMKDEEPQGWDQAPTDIHDPQRQRQPRTDGKGGKP